MVVFITVLALTMPAAAQVSNTSQATAGNFTTDVDDYLDVHSYSGVEFDKWFVPLCGAFLTPAR
ncbi:MAG: hypothetical protein LBQ88_22695 [Treponema sp.]|jgi:hypothetical protein|nr:hypothetical protein [Treponema sp.]